MKIIIFAITIFGIIACNSSKDAKNSTIKSDKIQELSDSYKVVSIEGVELLTVIPTLKFDFALNKVSGFAGCNDFSGVMNMEGNKIEFSKFIATEMYCDKMDIEHKFLSKLAKVDHFKIEKLQLKMYDQSGELLLIFEEHN